MLPTEFTTDAPFEIARRRLAASDRVPLFIADWRNAVFIHFPIAPRRLATLVPFDLDTRDGLAYVSLVAFRMRRLRPVYGGKLAALLTAPIADHAFLNVRTYVRHGEEPGIYFLAEWLPNRLAVFLGPRTFGLPYRLGRLDCQHDAETGRLIGDVADADGAGRLTYGGAAEMNACPSPARRGSLDEFLLERYACFTRLNGPVRRFRIWHNPWAVRPAALEFLQDRLLDRIGLRLDPASCVRAHFSSGVFDVQIGRPRIIRTGVGAAAVDRRG